MLTTKREIIPKIIALMQRTLQEELHYPEDEQVFEDEIIRDAYCVIKRMIKYDTD